MDIYDRKLKELRNRAKRNKVDIIESNLIKGKSSLNKFFSKADRFSQLRVLFASKVARMRQET